MQRIFVGEPRELHGLFAVELLLMLRIPGHPIPCIRQRAWTLQEFCSSQMLSIYTQGDGEPTALDGSGRCSVVEDEESKLMSFRRWHLGRLRSCVPYWICKSDEFLFHDAATMRSMVKQYEELAAMVYCTVEEDKLRALFPLVLATIPNGTSEFSVGSIIPS